MGRKNNKGKLKSPIKYQEVIYSPTEEQEGFFDFIRGDHFPWYSVFTLTGIRSPKMFCHTLLNRSHTAEPLPGEVNSEYCEYSAKVFLEVCEAIDVKVTQIHRLAFNNTFYSSEKWVPPHHDHEFKHKVFIMYLNDFDKGETFLLNDDASIAVTISPQKYKVIVFDDCLHTHTFCKPNQIRIAMVATFN